MRALFSVVSETRQNYAGARTYKLNAVMPKEGEIDAEVESFYAATPSGQFDITITNPNAYLELGKSYYVDFTPRPDPA